MEYKGKVYAKINGKYVECTESVQDLEDRITELNRERIRLQIEIAELKNNDPFYDND